MAGITLDPTTTALMVMDYQPGILAALEDADAQVAVAARAVATARDAGAHIGYVRVAMADAEIAAIPARAPMASIVSGGRDFSPKSTATQVHPDLAPRAGDAVVRKIRWGAFSTTDLQGQLDARGVETLVLAGISTSGVVCTTVREAADRDYRIVVLSDGCADPNEAAHSCLIEHVFPRQANVVETDELAAVFSS